MIFLDSLSTDLKRDGYESVQRVVVVLLIALVVIISQSQKVLMEEVDGRF